MKLVVAFCVLMIPTVAFAQHRTGGESFSGAPATSAGSSGGGGSSSTGSGSGSDGGVQAVPSDGGMPMAVHRPPNVIVPSNSGPANTSNGTFTNYSNLSPTVPEFARPRGSLPLNVAIPRGLAPAPVNSGVNFVLGSYNPWLYAYDGLFFSPLYGPFDPFFFDYGYAPVTTTSTTSPASDEKGVLHFRVKPRKAQVYIDSALVGNTTEFEGLFHRLKLDAGVHRLELRAPGYVPLVVNVRIQPGESITYRGELEKTAP
jgi:hypothetical protein